MKSATLRLPHRFWSRLGLFLTGFAVLCAVYLFQRFNLAGLLGNFHPNAIFVINRTARLILNDLACLLIIFALFQEAKYLKIAFWVFLIELLVILPVYMAVKLSLEGDSEISSPLLSQVHRLIVNPMLMILLIAGFLFQRYVKR
jgi:exosortase F-associated protein